MMTSLGVQTEPRAGPLYFFDQPTRRNRMKGTRSSMLCFNVVNYRGMYLEESNRDEDDKERKSAELNLSGETSVKPDTAALDVKDHDPMDAYKRAAPQILNELARLLSQYKWKEEGCLPRGIVNILNYSWQDLTAGASHMKSEKVTDTRRKSKGSLTTSCQIFNAAKEEEEEEGQCAMRSDGPSDRKSQIRVNSRVRRRKQNSSKDITTATFSISSGSCKLAGWIVEPKHFAPCDEPQWISLCQWVVERLQAARSLEKLETSEPGQNRLPILRYYGDTKAKLKDRRRKLLRATLLNGIPQIPKLKPQSPAQRRLHYRINDGSSVIYYPSGCIAVCHSHSGLPCGGFYTNVFSEGECPVILATVTAFGHGAVTHPVSSAITAEWDPEGGLLCDPDGNITKEWSWHTDYTQKNKIIIQVSDLISVQLFSFKFAMLSFKCGNENVKLPLRFLPHIHLSKEKTSGAAQDLLLEGKTTCPAGDLETKRNPMLTPVSFRSQEVLQMVREVEGLEEPPAHRRRRAQAGRELRRLQQRAQLIVDDWMDYYRVVTGIKCPDTERMPDAPLRTRLRREVQSAALPSLNPPEQADTKQVQPEEDKRHRHLSAPAERKQDSATKTQRTPKKQAKKESSVTLIGPLQIYGNIRPESVTLLDDPESQTSTAPHSPAAVPFAPSIPLTVCPALLRAALLGEGRRRRCCCSAALMPVVTDLEYDAFVMGQPPHSQQILVVCVTPPRQPINTHTVPGQDALEDLYRRRNKHRTMPCTQCQMDSFRLVRYEMPSLNPSCESESILLQQRHNAAPGMVLMYIRGKLLFVDYIVSGHGCTARDLQKQICRTRADYRTGLSLPSDYKFSDTLNNPDATQKEGEDITGAAALKKKTATARKNSQVPDALLQRQRDFCIKPRNTPTFPHVPVVSH